MADTFKALAHPVRREIVSQLRKRAQTAGELAAHFDLAKPTLSGHFAILKEADLISAERSGTTLTYRLNMSVAEDAMTALMSLLGVKGDLDWHAPDEEKEE